MSVIGELTRHLDAVVQRLEACDDADAEALARALREARPRDPAALSASAERILGALERSGRIDAESSCPREGPAGALEEAVDTLSSLARIVLGRP